MFVIILIPVGRRIRLQTLVELEGSVEDVPSFLKENYPERYAFLENWEELEPSLEVRYVGEGRSLVFLEVEEEEFDKLTNIFPSKEEAVGAFLITAVEAGWEEV